MTSTSKDGLIKAEDLNYFRGTASSCHGFAQLWSGTRESFHTSMATIKMQHDCASRTTGVLCKHNGISTLRLASAEWPWDIRLTTIRHACQGWRKKMSIIELDESNVSVDEPCDMALLHIKLQNRSPHFLLLIQHVITLVINSFAPPSLPYAPQPWPYRCVFSFFTSHSRQNINSLLLKSPTHIQHRCDFHYFQPTSIVPRFHPTILTPVWTHHTLPDSTQVHPGQP